MRIVLDASVAIKFYAPEPDSPRALAWLTGGDDFSVPGIFLVEAAQALLRHVGEERMTRADRHLAIHDLAGIVSVPFSSGLLIERAIAIADRLCHRLHDCMYPALAERLGCSMLTADDRLVRKVRAQAPFLAISALSDPP